MTTFAQHQQEYAAHRIATFPVRIIDGDKKPAVGNYMRVGLPGSAQLARRFADAAAFGFALGARSKITVLDCDSSDERILADAMSRHGSTPLVVRSGSGNFQGWYRHGGERRHIRPDPARPIDVLGGGFVVAPPSRGGKAPYKIIAGSLDDLECLPSLQNFRAALVDADIEGEAIGVGRRNKALWQHCMRHARHCDDFVALADVANTFASQCDQPLSGDEILRTARSAWGYTQRGENWIGSRHLQFDSATFPPSDLSSDPYLFTLLSWLRDHDAPGRVLLIADGLAKILGWSEHQLRETRRRATIGQWVVMIEPPSRNRAARFDWGPSSKRHGVWISEPIRLGAEVSGGGSVDSHVWNPEANGQGVLS
jgi:hypothetical protein